jgi:hypothetical protein
VSGTEGPEKESEAAAREAIDDDRCPPPLYVANEGVKVETPP